MIEFRICLDVDDVEKAVDFYTKVFGLKPGRRFDKDWAELTGGPAPIDLLGKRAGSSPYPNAALERNYDRHWTPAHLDFVVSDIETAVHTAQAHGAHLEKEIQTHAYGRLALMADPFGHGFCFLEFKGRGYDELLGS